MIAYFYHWFVKRAFMAAREDIYENIIDQYSETGSASKAILSSIFSSWGKRDAKRKLLIAQAHNMIARKLNSGESLAQAMAPFIPVEERLLISAGESIGDYPKALQSALASKRAIDSMRDAVSSALAQPVFGLIGILVSGGLMGKMLWPDLLRTFDQKYWDMWAWPLIQINIWLANNWQLFPLLGLVIVIYYLTLPTWTGRSRRFFDRIPPWNIYRDRNASTLLIVISGLMQNGKNILDAMTSIEEVATPYLRWHINMIKPRIKALGNDALMAFDTGLFSQPILDRMHDAAINRGFSAILEYLGDKALKSVVRIVKINAAIANTVATLLIGLMFAYSIAVQIIGTQNASDRYTAAVRIR